MQNNSYGLPEQAKDKDAKVTDHSRKTVPRRGVRASIWGVFVLLAWDVVFTGSFLLSLMVCPIWFFVSILKNVIQRPGWRLALLRIAIPALTLGLAVANDAIQIRIAKANAARVVTACEEFHVANGMYPQSLDELVPRYLPFVPRAKYCLSYGEFLYLNYDGSPTMLVWCFVPPFGQKVYNFENRRWSYID